MEMRKCPFCGADIPTNAQKCYSCKQWLDLKDVEEPDWHALPADYISTLLFAWFLGLLGAHRFYSGHFATGLAQLLTFGGFGIWSYVDLILLSINNFRDAKGRKLRDFNQNIATISLILAILIPIFIIGLIILLFVGIIAAVAVGSGN